MRTFILILATFSLLWLPVFAQDANKWHTAKARHFIVYYKNAPEQFLEQLIKKAEDDYDAIADALGFRRYNFWLWDNRAKIYIYDNAWDYQAKTKQPAWSSGSALVKDKIISTFAYAQGFFESVLPHEMGHIIFREFVGFDNPAIPLWLDEGVATYQEKASRLTANKIIGDAIKEDNLMDLEKLSNFNPQFSGDSASVNLFYAQSFSIVDYLVKEFGSDNFVLFCQALRDKKNLESALNYAYPFRKVQDLDKAWQRYIKHE